MCPSLIKQSQLFNIFLVTLYTVLMAVAVAAVITASQDLEVALKEKQTKLEQMETDLGSLKIAHSQTTKEFTEKQTGFEAKLNSLTEEKRKLDKMKQEGKAGELRDEDVRDVAAEFRDAAMVRFQGRYSLLS